MSVVVQKISDTLPSSTDNRYLLYQILGPIVLAGLDTIIAFISINGFSASIIRKLQMKVMKQKDVRVKKMKQLLSRIKIL